MEKNYIALLTITSGVLRDKYTNTQNKLKMSVSDCCCWEILFSLLNKHKHFVLRLSFNETNRLNIKMKL
ncbi:CLUMA_CG021638, isoform A [Clunio marinus]|uniref:CLUMA_CG021638, isoform A n=1 Tax=Clunio marinus TaxID=568069 RepID=A0A1J1J7W6_9DIPT|nr:CLUMA_CG021638, isoform A [Clunio marinus]